MTREELESNGWRSTEDPPNNDRVVQVMYDDGSTSEKALGFYDEVSQIPPDGKRVWWEFRNGRFTQYPNFIAWRDL